MTSGCGHMVAVSALILLIHSAYLHFHRIVHLYFGAAAAAETLTWQKAAAMTSSFLSGALNHAVTEATEQWTNPSVRWGKKHLSTIEVVRFALCSDAVHVGETLHLFTAWAPPCGFFSSWKGRAVIQAWVFLLYAGPPACMWVDNI